MAGASVNKVILLGNLGRDPEVRQTGSGKAVCTFTLATSERVGDEDRTEWHRIVVWGRTAENCGRYLSKGSPVYIEGRLQTRTWTDREGAERHTTEVVAWTVQFLRSDQGARRNEPPPHGAGGRRQGHGSDRGSDAQSGGQGYPDDEDEKVPF